MKIAVYAGSFDPLTAGHVSIVRQAARLFDHVRVLVAVNPEKVTMFTPEERVVLAREAVARLPNASVDFTPDLVVRYAAEIGAGVLVRGVRGLTDAHFELSLARANRELAPDVATVLLPADPELSLVSSSELKARAQRGEDLAAFCTPAVAAAVRGRVGAGPRATRAGQGVSDDGAGLPLETARHSRGLSPLERRWALTCTRAGITASRPAGAGPTAEAALADLLRRYAEPWRAYHTGVHLAEAFALLDSVAPQATPALDLALWYHDVVYRPDRHDNEAESATFARSALEGLGIGPATRDRVAGLIALTAHHCAPAGDADAALLLDVDLAILGAPTERFEEYERQIRSEYAHVPEAHYRTGRGAVLRGLAQRTPLFQTPSIREARETTARANLERTLASLG